MKYLRKFNSHSEFTTPSYYPNVTYCEEENEVHYYPLTDYIIYSKKYLTFKAITAGTITITASNSSIVKTISYSTDDGDTWTNLTTSTTAQTIATLAIGEKLLIKGENSSYGSSSYYNYFGGTAQVEVYGNIMSLIYGDDFENQTTLSSTYTFFRLFNSYTKLISAENLILPATTLANYCYEGMFYICTRLTTAPALPATTLASYCYQSMFSGCTSLTTAPALPATTLASYCYQYMFNGCTSLNYIKAMFTTTPSTTYTSNWVKGVAASGTFVKNSAATWSVTGVNGIPSNWTVETADA